MALNGRDFDFSFKQKHLFLQIIQLGAFKKCGLAGTRLEKLPRKRLRFLRIEILAREDVYIHRAEKVKGVDGYGAGQDEADR